MSQNVFIFVLIIVETIEVTLLFDNRNILAYTKMKGEIVCKRR